MTNWDVTAYDTATAAAEALELIDITHDAFIIPYLYQGSQKFLLVDGGVRSISITTGDIEIGAVELKNAADDTRAAILTDGTQNALAVLVQALLESAAGGYIRQDSNATIALESGGNLDDITTAVELIGDAVETDRVAVNLIGSQVGVSAGAGAVDATTQRSTLASDDPAVVALQKIDDLQDTITAEAGTPTKGVQVLADNGTTSEFIQIDATSKGVKMHNSGRSTLTNTFDQLTAAGSSTGFACPQCRDHTVQVVIASINTNVVMRVEGSLDNSSWFNLDSQNADTTIIANGTYGFAYTGILAYIRVTFVSESGGTAVTIDAKYLGGV